MSHGKIGNFSKSEIKLLFLFYLDKTIFVN